MSPLSVSVVVRAYNEAERLHRLLAAITPLPVEVIVVDNGSTDNTAAVVQEFGVKVVQLLQSEFSYPKSSNLGIAAARGEIIVLFSAHTLPEGNWLEIILPHFQNPKVGGVYTVPLPEKDSPFFERFLAAVWRVLHIFQPVIEVKKDRVGILDMTNAAFRRSCWEQHPLNEAYGAGGEDGEFARWLLGHGYTIIRDTRYRVRHSHYLTVKKYLLQQKRWRALDRPRPFNPSELSFRDDIKRS